MVKIIDRRLRSEIEFEKLSIGDLFEYEGKFYQKVLSLDNCKVCYGTKLGQAVLLESGRCLCISKDLKVNKVEGKLTISNSQEE